MKSNQIHITCVGDLFPADLPYHIGRGIAGKFALHKGHPWRESLKSIFDGSDIGIANLESPLVYKRETLQKKTFAGDPLFASFIKDIGLNLVSIANNHMLEHGAKNFYSTIDVLTESKIAPIGFNDDIGSRVYRYTRGESSVSFASFNSVHDLPNPSCYADYSEENVLMTLEAMVGSDFKILLFHWGDEYINIPSYEQVESAKKFIEAGADIIIGSHPHAIQPMMRHKNGIAIFSLGNFLFDMTFSEQVRTGMMAKIILEKGAVPQVTLHGVRIGHDYCPSYIAHDKFMALYNRYDEYFKRCLSLSPEQYRAHYQKELRFKRAIQRTYMKKDIITNLHRLSYEEYKYLLCRVLQIRNNEKSD